MPLCTGLPPGELMRSTTACAPSSSKATSAPETRARRWPRCRRRSRRAPPPAPCAAWCWRRVRALRDSSPRPRRQRQPQPGQAEEDAPAALAALLAQQFARHTLEADFEPGGVASGARRRRGGGAGRARRVGGRAGGRASRGVIGAFLARASKAPAGCRGKDTNTPARPLATGWRQPAAAAGAADAAAVGRLVAGAVDRAQDPAPSLSRNSPGCQSISVGTWAQRFR
jgi:hypothetical protein